MLKKILVVDDEPQILLMASLRLKANGYTVVTALSGEQGIDAAKAERPGLIFLDYVMSELNGAEVLARLKKDPATKSIPVIMFTADTKRVGVEEFRKLGAMDCLYKPFLPEEILQKAKEVFEKKA